MSPDVNKFVRFFSTVVFGSGWLKEVAVPRGFCLSVTSSLVPVPLCVLEV